MSAEIRVPALGESVTEATIARWLKQPGDAVAVDEPLVELETDKVSVEVPAPSAGVLGAFAVAEGDTVEVNALLGMVEDGGATSAPAPAAKVAPTNGAAANGAGAGAEIELVVPQAGESVTEADVGEIFKKAGDAVTVDEPIFSLETDKAAMDIGAPVSGVIKTIDVSQGDTVQVGARLAVIIEGGAAKPNGAAAVAASPSPTVTAETNLSPAPRRVIAEHGLNPDAIEGTGKGGRITKGDALAARDKPQPAPAVKPAMFKAPSKDLGPREERVRMTRLRQTIARRLKESQDTAVMLTTYNDVDMSAVMELRKQYKEVFQKKHGVKLGFMSFFVKACVHALKEVPDVNAEIDGTDIIYKNHYDIGVAVGSDKGLVVPVVRDADMLSLAGIEATISELGARARSGELTLEEMQGGTFTISNGGVYGSLMSMPIINPPQSGILGMHRIEQRPVAIDGQVVIRPMMYLAMSYDHRLVDGKAAVTFLVRVKESLEDPQRLLLDL